MEDQLPSFSKLIDPCPARLLVCSLTQPGVQPFPRDFKQQRLQQEQQQQRRRRREPGDASGNRRPVGSGRGGWQKWLTQRCRQQLGASSGGSSGSNCAAHLRPGPGGSGWDQVLGGLIPLSAGSHLQCPAPSMTMRPP